MSEPGDSPRSDLPPLESWALELEESESGGSDPRSREELARVVALLRSLPEPEAPPRLGEAILSRVAEDAARPRVLRVAFGNAGRAAALALAAGVAGLLVVTGVPGQLGGRLPDEGAGTPDSLVIRIPDRVVGQGFAAGGAIPRARGGASPQLVSLGAASHPSTRLGNPFAGISVWEGYLDHNLNQLQLDPDAFARQLEHAAGRNDFIAHLARRAGVRGDAPEIAMRVRSSRHPVAVQIVQRMLRASLIEHASRR